jgi:hypothetical protein
LRHLASGGCGRSEHFGPAWHNPILFQQISGHSMAGCRNVYLSGGVK